MTLLSFALVALGGAIGSVLRFGVATLAPRLLGTGFILGQVVGRMLVSR